jgi:hypothetical protein
VRPSRPTIAQHAERLGRCCPLPVAGHFSDPTGENPVRNKCRQRGRRTAWGTRLRPNRGCDCANSRLATRAGAACSSARDAQFDRVVKATGSRYQLSPASRVSSRPNEGLRRPRGSPRQNKRELPLPRRGVICEALACVRQASAPGARLGHAAAGGRHEASGGSVGAPREDRPIPDHSRFRCPVVRRGDRPRCPPVNGEPSRGRRRGSGENRAAGETTRKRRPANWRSC